MLHPAQRVLILGVPMDLGQRERGVSLGPKALRFAGLKERLTTLGYAVTDSGDLAVPALESLPEPTTPTEKQARYLDSVAEVCEALYTAALQRNTESEILLTLGGDHSISIGSVASVAMRGKVGVVWIDAHADYNTPQTSPSGNIHGMSLASLLGEGAEKLINVGYPGAKLRPDQLVMIGVRNLDREERARLIASGIGIFTMAEIDEHSVSGVFRRAMVQLASFDTFHISLDLDALDPELAPGVGTPVRGGLNYREAHLLMELFARTGKVRSLDIVEVNPLLDVRNRTAELAVELAASLLGQRII